MIGRLKMIEHSETAEALSSFVRAILLLIIVFLGIKAILWSRSAVFRCPVVGELRAPDLRDALQKGYAQYRDTPFMVHCAHHSMVVLPVKYCNEIKSLPESQLSFRQEIKHRYLGPYTGLGADDEFIVAWLNVELRRGVKGATEILREEMRYAAATSLPACPDWTAVTVYPKIVRIVALLSSRLFVGPSIGRNEVWISTSINYTIDAFKAAHVLWTCPAWQRPFLAPSIPELQKLKDHQATAARLLGPSILARMGAMEDAKHEKPDDMMQWIIDCKKPRDDIIYQAKAQLLGSLAAIHTTAMNITHIVYWLATKPEYLPPLRTEIEDMLNSDGEITKSSLSRLTKLDSFMKESQRLTPLNLVTSTLHLSDGLIIPKGTFIAMPSSEVYRDPGIYENPGTFDGFRFEKMRLQAGGEKKHQFVQTSPESLGFGHGSHGCPGRFIANNEIKVALIHIIQNYDLKLKDGEEKPRTIYRETSIIPDPTAQVLFKERTK